MPESQTPWTKEECRDRYVLGKRIGLRQLAIESGVNINTLNGWSRDGGWVECRKQVQSELTAKTDHKTIEKASDRNSDLAVEHLRSYQSARKVIDDFFRWQNQRLDEVRGIPERMEAEIKSIRPSNINFWLLALERAINGERLAAGLEWENVPKAIAFLERLGYTITDTSLPAKSDAEADLEAAPKGFTDAQASDIRRRILGIPLRTASSTALSSEVDIGNQANTGSREIAPSRH